MVVSKQALPKSPGVYFFKDADEVIIYVGKAKSLRSRVSSYFQKGNKTPKTQILVKQIVSMDYIITDSEVEALLLENKMIKKHKPKYNISLKDGKTFAYIKISAEPYPRIYSTRRLTKKGEFFGPYTDGGARRELQQLAVKLFKIRTCKVLPKRACLQYHIGLCTAPCIGLVSQEEYAQQVDQARAFLKGNVDVVHDLEREMLDAAAQEKYELALQKRNQISAINHLYEKQKVDLIKRVDQDIIVMKQSEKRAFFAVIPVKRGVIAGKREFVFDIEENIFEQFVKRYYSTRPLPHELIVNTVFWEDDAEKSALEEFFSRMKGSKVTLTYPQRGEKVSLVRMAEKNIVLEQGVLKELQEVVGLPLFPRVIECFDISNLGPTAIVAGMTRFVNGLPDTDGYRRFLIRDVSGKNDDFASMHEVITRRYSRLVREGKELPDLIVVDGGKGQLSSALNALQKVSVDLPIISLAKQEEEIFVPGSSRPILLPKNSPVMLLLRGIRDRTHKQAITYNRKRREIDFREDSREN